MDNFYFSDYDIQQQIIAFMLQNGIVPYDQDMLINTDGLLHRFRTQDDTQGETSGAYCIFADNWPAGWVQDWRKGQAINWSFPRELLDEE
jgi:phage/plasmid primase-like uncharacterized protein